MIHADHITEGSVSFTPTAHTYTTAGGNVTQTVANEELRTVGVKGNKKGDITENQLRKENGKIKEERINMKRIVFCLMLVFFVIGCNSQNNKRETITEMENIQVFFSPSSGGDAIYSIFLIQDSLCIKIDDGLSPIKKVFKMRMTIDELKNLKAITNQIKKRDHTENEINLDTWRIEVKINGVKFFNRSNIRLETLPHDIKSLIDFVQEKSKIKIDLYAFS